MEKKKKKLIILSIIAALLILAVVIALLCIGKPGGTPAPEQTEPTLVNPTVPSTGSSTTPPTKAPTDPTDPTENTLPSATTEPAETVDPSAPTNPTKATEPSAPATDPTVKPTQPATQATKPATTAPTQAPTKAPTSPTSKPTTPATQPATSSAKLKINTEEYTGVPLGSTLQLDYTYLGKKTLKWTSSDPSIISVDQKGVVKSISSGTATITVSDGQVQASVTIRTQLFVVNTPSGTIVEVGETLQIDYEILVPADFFMMSSNNESVCTVDDNGLVTALKPGIAFLTIWDGCHTAEMYIYVAEDDKRTTSFDLSIDCPLYDGVTKFVGNYLQINHLNSRILNADRQWSGIFDNWYTSAHSTKPDHPARHELGRNYYITSSNPDVISVVNKYDEGFYDDFLYFNKPGKSTITITSWDGYSESYTIHVKAEYACAPKEKKLTPGEFAYCASMVGVEDGGKPSYDVAAYLYLYLTDEDLTWERARKTGHDVAKREFRLQTLNPIVVYAGFDEERGMHLFYTGGGGEGAGYEKYDPPAGSDTGPIRFPGTELSMLERSGLLLEVLGDTSDGYVTYTSSDPNVVKASGGFLLAQNTGTAVITATYKGQETKIPVTVERDPSIQGVVLHSDVVTLYSMYASKQIHCSHYYPGTLTWTSSDPSIATVNDEGIVTPHKSGQCIITVTDGISTDSCIVIVQ